MEIEGWWVKSAAILVSLLVSYISLYARKFIKKLEDKFMKDSAMAEALDLLLEGISKAEDDLGRDLKQSAADGKLSKAEIGQLETIAITHVREVATGPAREIVLNWTSARVKALIKQLIGKVK